MIGRAGKGGRGKMGKKKRKRGGKEGTRHRKAMNVEGKEEGNV